MVHTKDNATHEEVLRQLLQLLRINKLCLKRSKCSFFQKSAEFVGFRVDSEGLHADEAKISAITKWLTPTCKRNIREFLGLAGFYRKFIFRFAHVALPLYELTNKYGTFHWTDDCASAFALLKTCL